MRLKLPAPLRSLHVVSMAAHRCSAKVICRADANLCGARIEPIEIDWPREQSYKRREPAETQRRRTVDASDDRRRYARFDEIDSASWQGT